MHLLQYIIPLLLLLLLAQVAQCYRIRPRELLERYSSLYADLPNSCDNEQDEQPPESDDIVSWDPETATTEEPPQDRSSCNLKSSSNFCKHSEQGLGMGSNAGAAIAQKAAQMAKAANEAQTGAAEDAAKLVRMQLAETAMQAARAVNAVLEGKEAIVENYQRELHDAEDMVIQVSASLESSEANAQSASAASTFAETLKGRLEGILEQTVASLVDIDALDEQVNADLQEKTEMLARTEELAQRLEQQLATARQEYDKVKEAARQAANAAEQARQKVEAEASTCGSKSKRVAIEHCQGILALYGQRRHQREARMLQQKQHLKH
ncbi:uncharacterized protein LOC111066278 [Drosophila obscura]|uniref:uncharacterized protein LOC111066278 n=1 Tax=Drosophila obscura TaxID=7282 RepID=UPI001BB1C8B1|nr:uncharacterized protein LOC111066278 [Drosophila obscura]